MPSSVPTSTPAPAPTPVSKAKKVQRPDKATFEATLKKLEADIQTKNAAHKQAQDAIRNYSASGPDSKRKDEIKATLTELKGKQAEIKNQRGKIAKEITQINERIQKRSQELQASKSKVNFKSVEELDAHVSELEKKIDSGSFRIVEERKALNEISTLKKLRKNFGSLSELKTQIDEDKKKISELKAESRNPEASAISEQYEKAQKELDEINEKSKNVKKSRDNLYDARNKAKKELDAAYTKLKAHKDEYYGQLRTYREQNAAEIAAREERQRIEREEAEKEKRLAIASEKLEEASQPAFSQQIATAKLLLAYFDPTYKDTSDSKAAATTDDLNTPRGARVVEAPAAGKILKKEKEVFFVGKGGKKNKKTASSAAVSETPRSDKLTIDYNIISDLSDLNIGVPGSNAEVPTTIENLKKKLEYYAANEERVTKERIERAKAEIAKLEEAEKADETSAEAEADSSE